METVKKSRADWRADVHGIDNLYDVDPLEMLIFLRHQYLESAKDLVCKPRVLEDHLFGLNCCEVAEALQEAIELQGFKK